MIHSYVHYQLPPPILPLFKLGMSNCREHKVEIYVDYTEKGMNYGLLIIRLNNVELNKIKFFAKFALNKILLDTYILLKYIKTKN